MNRTANEAAEMAAAVSELRGALRVKRVRLAQQLAGQRDLVDQLRVQLEAAEEERDELDDALSLLPIDSELAEKSDAQVALIATWFDLEASAAPTFIDYTDPSVGGAR